YFGWLSIVPRAGYRGTYYGKTWDLGSTVFVPPTNPLVPDFILPPPTTANPIKFDGDTFRSVFDTGAEASFKISRTWENVQSSSFGLDGLMHVIQPFTDFSYVKEDGPVPLSILQFDRFEPSTPCRRCPSRSTLRCRLFRKVLRKSIPIQRCNRWRICS